MRGTGLPCAGQPVGKPCPQLRVYTVSTARDIHRSRNVRPLRRADVAADRLELGVTRRRSWQTRAAERYTAESTGMAASIVSPRTQDGTISESRATKGIRVGNGRPSTTSRRRLGVASESPLAARRASRLGRS